MAVMRSSLAALAAVCLTVALVSAETPTVPPATPGAAASAEASATTSPQPPGVVRAVLFYSENCPHCADVIYRILPPIQQIFGSKLEVLQLKVQDPYGDLLYQMAMELYLPADEPPGVPMMVIGDKAIIGATPIGEQFPVLVQTYLSQGGVDWPAIPGLRESIAAAGGTGTPVAGGTAPPAATPTETPTDTPQPTAVPSATPTLAPTATPVPPFLQRAMASRAGQALGLLVIVVVLGAVLVAVGALRGRR